MAKIPTKEECIELLRKYEAPEKLIEHSLKVAEVAVFISQKLVEKGENINIPLVQAAALLHDLDKMKTLDDHKKHGRVAYEILTREGYLNVATIIIKHNPKSLVNGDITKWEEFLINYADKRVLENYIVPLSVRFQYVKLRYPGLLSEKEEEACLKAEKEMFSVLDFEPEQLLEVIS